MAGFPKSERLSGRALIQNLFSGRNRKVTKSPVLVVYQFVERGSGAPLRVLFSVSKKRVPRAVDRNRLKRRMREAYRKNKEALSRNIPQNQSLLMGVVYVGRTTDVEFATFVHSFEKINEEFIARFAEGI